MITYNKYYHKNGLHRCWWRLLETKVTVRLATSWCWWLNVGGHLWVLVAEFRYWRHILNIRRYRKNIVDVYDQSSSTSYTCHQHISYPTSVTKSLLLSSRYDNELFLLTSYWNRHRARPWDKAGSCMDNPA